MLSRRALLHLPLAGYLSPALAADPQKRRALVVGIDQYSALKPAAGSAVAPRGGWHDLDGAVNDALLMCQILRDRFGIAESGMVLLTNAQATRDRILLEFRRQFIEAASPGDAGVMYFAGHGSQVKNLASEEADQMDETLVPYDAQGGAADIRDKELARLCSAAAQKGVSLTLILDTCHSGGMARGAWNAGGKKRFVEADPRPVTDSDRETTSGAKPPDPASLGVLYVFAAREDQPATETEVQERRANETVAVKHGAFTAALARVLQSPSAEQSLEQICGRVRAQLASQGNPQVPICAGRDRSTRGLFGEPAGAGRSLVVPVTAVRGDVVHVEGGAALGLAAGCTLVRTSGVPVRLRLTRANFGDSEAQTLGTAADIQPGDVFRLETWVAPPNQAIRMFAGNEYPERKGVIAALEAISRAARASRIELAYGLDGGVPDHVLYWRGGGWELEAHPADGKRLSLGPSLDPLALANQLRDARVRRLWPIGPPDGELGRALRLGAGSENPVVELAASAAECVYFLSARWNENSLEYAWFLKEAGSSDRDSLRLPAQTDWKKSADDVTEMALRLARIYGWLNLNSPGDDVSFPYRFSLEKAGTRQRLDSGPVRFGEKFKVVFEATAENLRRAQEAGGVSRRYVYFFVIDSAGEANCLFPEPANGNEGNLIPRQSNPPLRIEATRLPHDFEIGQPAGIDNYVLVTSAEPLDPGVFQWTGVRTVSKLTRAAKSPLQLLFGSLREGKRGLGEEAVPVTWSIQSMAIRSAP